LKTGICLIGFHNANIAEPINKVFSIGIIVEDISLLNSPTYYDVTQNSGGVYAGLAGHNFYKSQRQKNEKHNFMNVSAFHWLAYSDLLFHNNHIVA
jgi:hypothetical protein